MPIIMPPVVGPTQDTWATLEFGSYYLKEHPEAAPTRSRGLVQDDLDFGEIRAQNMLEPLMIMYYPEDTVASWVNADIPPIVKDWANELAAAYALHEAAASGRMDRKNEFEEWISRVIQKVIEWLSEAKLIQAPDGSIIEARTTPINANRKGPVSSARFREPVFDDETLREMVEVYSRNPRNYMTDEEAEADNYGIA